MKHIDHAIDENGPLQVVWSSKNCNYLIYFSDKTISLNDQKVLSKTGKIISYNEFLKLFKI